MATKAWHGDTQAVAQIAAGEITNHDVTTTYTITVSGVSVSTPGRVNEATTAGDLVDLAAASTDVRFLKTTWTNPAGADIVATVKAANKGTPLDAVLSVSGGAGTVDDFVDTTENSGPNVWGSAANWHPSLPVNGDDVIIHETANSILYDLDQSALELASFTVDPTFTGTIGLPTTNPGGYIEHLPVDLSINTDLATIDASGSSRCNFDFDSTDAVAVTVLGSGTAAVAGIPVVTIRGTNAGNTLFVEKGSVGVSQHSGDTSVFATASVAYRGNQSSDSSVTFGADCTLGVLTVDGGTVTICTNVTTINQTAGIVALTDAATVTTWNANAGTARYESTGTATTINVATATLDFRRDRRPRTVTNMNVFAGASVYDPSATVTWTNEVILTQCGLTDVALDLGTNFTWTPTPI